MKGPAVALDNQPSVDDQVNSPDAGDLHLNLDLGAESAQQQTHERLGSGLAPRIEKPPQGAVALRQPSEHSPQAGLVDESEVPRALERGDGVARVLTAARLGESLNEVGGEGFTRRRGPTPMRDDAGPLRQPRRPRLELRVKRVGGANEHAQ